MSENTKPRKRLILKLSYPPGSRNKDENKRRKIEDCVKPIVTCYWVDSNYRTKSSALSQPKNNDNVVEDNQVSKTRALSQPEVVEDKKMIKNQVFKTSALSQTKNNDNVVEDKKVIKNQVSNRVMPNNIDVENKKIIKNQVSKTEIGFNGGEECGLKKKPMECVKRRQCWLILKRMMVDRDGWDLLFSLP
ncbi:unnamed protein product [Lathyrus sativus]|nr:unnamed protein product [Lathyrus sativus]